ncbi:putative DNA binding domain-containing protein [Citricoccus nitrophenolicus]
MGLLEVRERFFAQFPAAEILDSILKSQTNPHPTFFMSSVSKEPDLKNSGLALLRLGSDLERRFGINGEVAVYFTPWRDFQRRSFNAITLRNTEIVSSLQEAVLRSERFTPSRRIALLVSTDPQVHAKLDEWQNDSFSELTVVPVDPMGTAKDSLLGALANSLRIRLGERDLYQTQNPVSGIDFFGRTRLLRDLSTAIDGDQNVAILGLRRSGKTSVLRELRRMLAARRIVMPIADFQMLEEHSVEDLASSIASSLNEELKTTKSRGLDIWIGNESEQNVDRLTPVALSDRIKRVASRNAHLRIVIAVDEVESAAAIALSNPNAIKVLLGALRSAAQARENVSLVFSGVANRMFRSSSLGTRGEVDNPMFNQVTSVYLTSFENGETGELLRDLGRPMLLDWQTDAINEVHNLTGGFPFFVRDLASTVRSAVRARTSGESGDAQDVTADDVLAVSDAWSTNAAEAWNGIVQALGIHYPAAAALLDPTISEEELDEWIIGDPQAQDAAEDLLALKLLKREDVGIRHTTTLAALQALGSSRQRGVGVSSSDEKSRLVQLANLIRAGESQVLEFKETSRINVRTSQKDLKMEDSVVKTVAAFLNTDGGDLLVGVTDDGTAKGLDLDLKLFSNSADRFERWIRGDLLARRIDKQLVTDHVRTTFMNHRGKQILWISVSGSGAPAWVDDKIIYRRLGNQTIQLDSGRDIQNFMSQRNSV